MKVSLNTIQQLIDFDLPPVDELVRKINAQLGGVEEVIDLGEKYKDAKIVKVMECDKHENADKLSVCKIDAGTGELVQVVCGAPNVHADMWAIWLPPESIVPETYGTKEPYVLGARELRGVVSNGMLASARELGLGDDHDGIIEIYERDVPEDKELKAGESFADVFGLSDTIIDIENKMFTHRPDLFGQLGVAREIAGIFGHTFDDPKWYYELEEQQTPTGSFELKSFNDAGANVSRLMLVGMDNVTVAPSPLWMKTKLVALGGKPINNVVDVTNYVMLMTSQPTHCYDYDKLAGGTVGARMARNGETVKLLNGKIYELTDEDIAIVDGERPIGLGGIMGGGESEVSSDTKRIVLEVANFDMYAVRKSSMRHGLFTDALTRFNKGQSMLMIPYICQYAVKLLHELSGAKVATGTYDDLQAGEGEWRAKPAIVPMLGPSDITAEFINKRLGLSLSVDDIINLLTNVGFECENKSDNLSYWSPAWRMDIQDREDVVEEVGRLYGFDKLPRDLPKRSISPAPDNSIFMAKQLIRETLANAGANEVLTYSFVHEKTFQRAEQDVEQAFRLSNALSPDLQYYRMSVLPSLLDKVHANINSSHDEFVLFEIGKGHNKKYHADDEDGLPKELEFVDVVYASKQSKEGAAFYKVRRLLDIMAARLGIDLVYKPIEETLDFPVTAPFDQARSALVETVEGVFIGMIGELKPTVRRNFKLPDCTAAMTLDFEGVAASIKPRQYKALSRFPSVRQDISLKVATDLSYKALMSVVDDTIRSSELEVSITPISIYQSADDIQHKTVTLRVQAFSYERTLKEGDVSQLLDEVAEAANHQLQAERV